MATSADLKLATDILPCNEVLQQLHAERWVLPINPLAGPSGVAHDEPAFVQVNGSI